MLGFEYGYSLGYPDALVLWEAQFGDFANAAQVIIDQFIASAEDKWRQLSGLVLLLPHGFEGQGPEHSSARLERFLQLAAEDNIQVAIAEHAGAVLPLLRRQALRRWQKPLVVMTPKSLLRHPRAVSPLEEFTEGRFRRVVPDARCRQRRGDAPRIAGSGKIYYELEDFRRERQRDDVAIVRIEQLYPLPTAQLEAALAAVRGRDAGLSGCRKSRKTWGRCVSGVWRWGNGFSDVIPCISLPGQARPARPAGRRAHHRAEQAELLALAFGEPEKDQSDAQRHVRQAEVQTG